MIRNFEAKWEGSTLPQPAEQDLKKPYESPLLRDWGSLLELTGGALADITDANFDGGSGGV
jgi:hypothetical protein